MKQAKHAERARIGEEIAKMPAEPLLPIEKKLIAWSLLIGLTLLAVLVWTGNSALTPGP